MRTISFLNTVRRKKLAFPTEDLDTEILCEVVDGLEKRLGELEDTVSYIRQIVLIWVKQIEEMQRQIRSVMPGEERKWFN